MLEVLFYFILASCISFVGSLQPGPVNMAVALKASNKQYKQAVYIAFGGSVPEFVMCFVAMRFSFLLSGYEGVIKQFSAGFSCILIPLGIGLFFSKAVNKIKEQNGSYSGFMLGFLLGLFNPQLVLFWLGVLTWLSIHGFDFEQGFKQYAFVLGTSAGAFVLHLLLLFLIKSQNQQLWVSRLNQYGNKIIGVIFVLLGIFNLVFA